MFGQESGPIVSPPGLAKTLNLSYNATQLAIQKLEAQNIVSEISGRQRNKVYIAPQILEVLQLPSVS